MIVPGRPCDSNTASVQLVGTVLELSESLQTATDGDLCGRASCHMAFVGPHIDVVTLNNNFFCLLPAVLV
jgi:hypothetical protein